MNRSLTLAWIIGTAAALTAGPCAARAETPANVAGTWQLRFVRQGRPPGEATLKLEKAGDKYVGVLTDSQGKGTPIKEAHLSDGELSFVVTFDRQGQEIKVTYKAKVTGDTLKGQVTFEALGMKRSIDLDGKRVNEQDILAGLWKITLVLESGQKLQPLLVLKQAGDTVSGDYIGHSGNKTPLKDVKFAAGELSFRVPDRVDDDGVVFQYVGKKVGAAIKGTVKFRASNRPVSVPFEAHKSQMPTADVAGTWKLRIALKNGPTFEPTLKLVQQGMALSGVYAGEQGETPITDALVLGDEITFDVARDRDGKKYKLHCQAQAKGDTLKGTVDYYFDGVTGFVDFEAKRLPAAATKKP
jgi:hypothetical protein